MEKKSILELEAELLYLKAINKELEKIDARSSRSKMPSDGEQHSMTQSRDTTNMQRTTNYMSNALQSKTGRKLKNLSYEEIMQGLVQGDYKNK